MAERDVDGVIYQKLGGFEARIENLEGVSQEMRGDIKNILDILATAKGGWKAMLMIGGVAGAVGALMTKLIPFLSVLR